MIRQGKHNKDLSDEAIITAYQHSHDITLVGILFERYTDIVFLICMKYLKNEAESEDMTMQIFEKLIKDLKQYPVRSFKYWLHSVVKNQCLGQLDKQQRKEKRIQHYKTNIQQNVHELSPFITSNKESLELRINHLESALSLLKMEQKTCVELFYLKQKSYIEVAEITGYSLKQVKSYIQNGKRNLKKHLEEQSGDE